MIYQFGDAPDSKPAASGAAMAALAVMSHEYAKTYADASAFCLAPNNAGMSRLFAICGLMTPQFRAGLERFRVKVDGMVRQ